MGPIFFAGIRSAASAGLRPSKLAPAFLPCLTPAPARRAAPTLSSPPSQRSKQARLEPDRRPGLATLRKLRRFLAIRPF
jgi:hypothetical protein